jgi:hypothetical protein
MEASVATPGQGAPAAGVQAPAGAQGAPQGQPTAAGKGDGATFNWGNFPDVPAEQRELLEPHLRNVQGHVTRMEQQYAPYQGLLQAVQPDQVENLVGFLNGYSNDPVATIVGIAQQLQQEGQLTAEHLAALTGQQAQAPQTPAQPGQEEMPPWAQELQQKLGAFEQQQQAQQQAQIEAEQGQMLEQAKAGIRGQLATAGITEELVTDEMIVASIIANDGDEQAAANMLSQMRQNFLGAFANGKTGGPPAPNVQGEVKAPAKAGGRRRGDGFDDAKVGAKQYLEQQMAMGGGG